MADKNPFEDLFEKGNPFADIFKDIHSGRLKPASEEEVRAGVLLSTFRTEIRRGDKSYLEETIINYKEEILEGENAELLEAYSKASLFVGNNPLGYESLKRIKFPNFRHIQALGLIAYTLKDFDSSVGHFKNIEEKLFVPSRIAYSLSMINTGKKDLPKHRKILESILGKSDLANSLLGILSLESRDKEQAEVYFDSAVKLNPKSERARLDLMRIKILNGKQNEVFSGMNDFYIETNSRLTAEEITKELETRVISLPKFRIKNLFQVVDSLLGE